MTQVIFAERARAKKTAEASASGIDDVFISKLVERFYGSVRSDQLFGSIFQKRIADWTSDLARMKDFWASVTLEPTRFRGRRTYSRC